MRLVCGLDATESFGVVWWLMLTELIGQICILGVNRKREQYFRTKYQESEILLRVRYNANCAHTMYF